MLSPSLAAALGAAAVGSVVGATALMPGAQAATQIPVTGLPGFGQVVVDTAANRVFVSEGINASSSNSTTPAQGIVVTDLSGNYLTTIDQGTGAQGLTLAPDGMLYAALSITGEVAQIDPTTYSETDYPLPSGEVPEYVAAQSGKVWVSYNNGVGHIGDITPGTTSSFEADIALAPSGGWYSAPLLSADPSNGGTVVGVDPGEEPFALASFDVSGATPAIIAGSNFFSTSCAGTATSIAVLPGGQQFTMACGNASTTSDPVFSSTDLSVQSASYATPDGSGAIAVAPDGAVATGGSTAISTGTQPADLNVFSAGGTTPAQSYTEGDTGIYGRSLAQDGLAWGDSTVLAAVMAGATGDPSAPYTYQVRVITYPLLTQSALVMNYIEDSSLGSAISVSGVLTVNGTAAPGQTVTISRSVSGGTPVQVGQATTDSYGVFTISDTPSVPGAYTYTASFAGDSATAPDTATGTATVWDTAQIALQIPSTAAPNRSFQVNGTLTFGSGASASGDTVTITRTDPDGTTTTATVTTGTGGLFSLTTKLSTVGTYTYTANYADNTGMVTAQASSSLTVAKRSS
jgi:streptogramin lyase